MAATEERPRLADCLQRTVVKMCPFQCPCAASLPHLVGHTFLAPPCAGCYASRSSLIAEFCSQPRSTPSCLC